MTPDLPTYWSTVAQLAAVFGLGLVIEVRELAKDTRTTAVLLVQVIAAVASGFALVYVLITALGALLYGRVLIDPGWVNLALVIVGSALIVNPLVALLAGKMVDRSEERQRRR